MDARNGWAAWRTARSGSSHSAVAANTIDEHIKLEPFSELRFEVEERDYSVNLVLVSGSAEIFGTKLQEAKRYEFETGAKVGVFTNLGCELHLQGKLKTWYVSKETPMLTYIKISEILDHVRTAAEQKDTRGPIVMVVGPNNVGKSTLCRIFLNYAVRLPRRPLFADIDVGRGDITIPGAMASIIIEEPASAEHGFSKEAPLVFHFGRTEPGSNSVLYKQVVAKLAEKSLEMLRVNSDAKHAGIIINTCGWIKNEGYTSLLHAAQSFQVDFIFVLDQERLHQKLVRDMPRFVRVLTLLKSGGVVQCTDSMRIDARTQRLKEYFYNARTGLPPHSFDVKFENLKIYKIGIPPLPESCVPSGMKVQDNQTKVVSVTPSPQLLHHILAISVAKSITEDVIGSNVVGFICVTEVDMEKKVITVLSPRPCPLPEGLLLLSEQQFTDSHA